MRTGAACALLALWLGTYLCVALALELSPQESRGKAIYLTGTSPSGEPLQARVGKEAIELSASTVPCGNCHGRDGLGRPEGGVLPPSITWSYLTKSYGHLHDNGRRHPAFTEETVKRAITDGVDPAGNALEPSMPRYAMSASDLADLVAYMKRLEADSDPGLTASSITLGTVLPGEGPAASLGQAMRAMLEAYIREVNAQGGIYSRRLELKVAEASTEPGSALAGAQRLLGEGGVFALVGAFTAGSDQAFADLVERERVPLVGPFTLFPQDSLSLNRFTFYLLPGLA